MSSCRCSLSPSTASSASGTAAAGDRGTWSPCCRFSLSSRRRCWPRRGGTCRGCCCPCCCWRCSSRCSVWPRTSTCSPQCIASTCTHSCRMRERRWVGVTTWSSWTDRGCAERRKPRSRRGPIRRPATLGTFMGSVNSTCRSPSASGAPPGSRSIPLISTAKADSRRLCSVIAAASGVTASTIRSRRACG